MPLDESDGSDMELDSDTPEGYYSHSSIVSTYDQCSTQLISPNTDESSDSLSKSLSNDKKNVSTLHLPQNENVIVRPPNNGSDYIRKLDTKLPKNSTTSLNTYCAPPQPPSPPFNSQGPRLPPWSIPENTMNIFSQPPSPPPVQKVTSIKTTLKLNTTSQPRQPKNGFPLKSPMDKSPTKDNIINEPTPLEKHDRIRFELKSKNKLADKRTVNLNTPARKITGINKNAYDVNSTFVDKSLSLSNPLIEKGESRQGKSKGYKIDDIFKGLVVGNRVAAVKEPHKKVVINNSSGILERNFIEIKKEQNKRRNYIGDDNTTGLIKENSIIIEKNPDKQDQVICNDSTRLVRLVAGNSVIAEKNNDKRQEQVVINDNSAVASKKDQIPIDDNDFTVLVKNSATLKGQIQKKNRIDDDNSKIQGTNLEVVQKKEQVVHVKEKHQIVEVQQVQLDDGPSDFIRDIITENKFGDATAAVGRINNEVQVTDIDNNNDTDYPSLSTINTEEGKSDFMELDQVNDQDHKMNEDVTPKIDIIEKTGIASSRNEENEIMNSEKSEANNIQYTPKNKKMTAPVNEVINPTNQSVASSSRTIETPPEEATDQVADVTSHVDHLTNLMTEFANQINKTSRQTNPYNNLELQSSQIQRQIDHIQPINQSTQQSTSQMPKDAEEIIDSTELSSEIVEKYHKLDATLLEFDEVSKKVVNAYDELYKLLPEGTVIKIDPPTTYKWDVITSMFGITNINKLEKYITDSEDDDEIKKKINIDEKKSNRGNNGSRKNAEEETSSGIEYYDEDIDVPSDDPDDKNFRCRSTILKQPNPKRWHNTRSNRPPSANLRQRTKSDPDSPNVSITSTTPSSSPKKKQSQTTPKRALRIRKDDDKEDDNPTVPGSQKHLDLDKYYKDGKPRRPANGFSFFCGDMCAKVRNERLPISGTIAYAAEIWKKMTDEEKKPWLDRGVKSKNEYQELINKWKEEQEELKNSTIGKRTVSPKVKNGSSKKPRND